MDGIDWEALIGLRTQVAGELERLRAAGEIGAPLEAEVRIECPPAAHAALSALGDELRFFLITSAAAIVAVPGAEAIAVRVTPTTSKKCVRCWHRVADVGTHAEHPELCGRCVSNITGPGETRHYA